MFSKNDQRLGIILLLSGLGVFILHLLIAADFSSESSVKDCMQLPTAMTKINC